MNKNNDQRLTKLDFRSVVVTVWCDQTERSRSGWLMNLADLLEPESLVGRSAEGGFYWLLFSVRDEVMRELAVL